MKHIKPFASINEEDEPLLGPVTGEEPEEKEPEEKPEEKKDKPKPEPEEEEPGIQVKIGGAKKLHDLNKEPILIVFQDEQQKQDFARKVANMKEGRLKFGQFPDDWTDEERKEYKSTKKWTVHKVECSDEEGTLKSLLEYIKEKGGQSFSIVVDPDGDAKTFRWDGKIKSIESSEE